MSKTVLFHTIQFSLSTQFKCKYTVKFSKTFLFQAIQLSQTVLIQFSAISRTRVGRSYPSVEVQSVYSTAPADWGRKKNEVSKRATEKEKGNKEKGKKEVSERAR